MSISETWSTGVWLELVVECDREAVESVAELFGRYGYNEGVVIDEPYIQAAPTYSSSWVVPDGQYFVLGDNRNNSSDSHAWGFLPIDHILGKALVVYWPPSDWSRVPHHDFPSS